MNTFIPIIIVTFFISIFLLFKFTGSGDWIETEALIKSFESKEVRLLSTKGEINTHDYKINIKYEYDINGVKYIGDTLAHGLPNATSDGSLIKNLEEAFTEKNKIKIFYNPKSVNESAIITAKGVSKFKLIFIVSIMFGLVGIIFYGLYKIKIF